MLKPIKLLRRVLYKIQLEEDGTLTLRDNAGTLIAAALPDRVAFGIDGPTVFHFIDIDKPPLHEPAPRSEP